MDEHIHATQICVGRSVGPKQVILYSPTSYTIACISFSHQEFFTINFFNSAWFIIYRMPHTLLPLFVFGQIWGWCRVQLNLRCFFSKPHSVLLFRLQVASGAFHCESFACALSKSLCMPNSLPGLSTRFCMAQSTRS